MVREAVKLKMEAFSVWLAQGSSESSDTYREARRAAALAVAEAREREKVGEAMESGFWLTSWKPSGDLGGESSGQLS